MNLMPMRPGDVPVTCANTSKLERDMTFIKRFLSIGLFVLIFVYLYIHVTYIFREPLSHTREHMMGFYSEGRNTVDVAVIGTSCTFSAIAPMLMWEDHGIPAYDFCTNVMLEESMRYALREVCSRQSPELVIIDIAPFMNAHRAKVFLEGDKSDKQAVRCNTDGYKLSKNRFDLINELITDKDDRLSYYLDLLYYHSNPAPEFSDWNWNRPSANKGYSNLQIEAIYDDEYIEDSQRESGYTLDKDELAVLDGLLDEVDRQGVRVLFIIQPYWNVEGEDAAWQRTYFLQDYIRERGYDVLNMHDHIREIGMKGSEDYSMDYNHYNIYGAIKITRFLGDHIADEYGLSDKRGTAGYEKWENEYKEWDEVLKNNKAWTDRLMKEYITEHNIEL